MKAGANISDKQGKIIFLNGTSSAGKTSLAKALQSMINDEYCYLSRDEFMNEINQSYLRLFPFLKDDPVATIEIGLRIVNKSKYTLFATTIKAFAEMGRNVIVDHVLDQALLDECVLLLGGYHVTFIGVHCPLHELERRELERGNRKIGLAKSQYNIVHSNVDYDLNVNTYEMDINSSAQQIIKYVESEEPAAFKKLMK
jgi:chloramphenicol 3-O phosphotransferase